MRITITKGERSDRIDVLRKDLSEVGTTFPHKGPVPHDAVHFFVESGLGIADGFWGMVSAGRHPEEIAGIAKAAGHASAKRAGAPDPSIVPILQAERTVECFEADLWGGSRGDIETLRQVIAAGCAQSNVPAPDVADSAIAEIRTRLIGLREQWSSIPDGGSITLEWTGGIAA
jgi:hypothetical protein